MPTFTISDVLWEKWRTKAAFAGVSPETLLENLLDTPPPTPTFWQKVLASLNTSWVLVDAQQSDLPVVEVNATFEQVTGYAREEVVGKNLRFLQGDDYDQPALTTIRDTLQVAKASLTRLRNYKKDGTLFWNELYISPIYADDGQLTHYIAIQNDVTREEFYKRELAEQERQTRQFIELSNEGIWRVNSAGKTIFVNRRMAQLLGYTVPEFLALAFDAIQFEGAILPEWEAAQYGQRQDSLPPLDVRFKHRDGHTVWTITTIRLLFDDDGKYVGALGFVTDITERKLAEMRLAESEVRFRTMADSAPVLIWVSDKNKNCIYFNKSWLAFTGRTHDQEIGTGWTESVHPDDYERVITTCHLGFDQRQSFVMEYRMRRHDGVYRWLRDEGVPRYTPDGQFAGFIGSCTDITEIRAAHTALEQKVQERTRALQQEMQRREQAETELRREHDLLENVIRMSPAAILVIDVSGAVMFASDRAKQIIGQNLTNQNILGNWQVLDIHGQPIPPEQLPVQQVFATQEPIEGYELHFETPDNDKKTISVNAAPLLDDKGNVKEVVATIEDITLRKQWETTMQSSLAHERQLNTMKSQFISTITHEFKTPLTVMRTSCFLLRTKHEQMLPNEYFNRIDRIEYQIKRLNGMIDDIVLLNRMNTISFQPHYEWVNLEELLRHIVEDVQVAYQNQVKIEMTFPDHCQRQWLDATLVHQILLNLVSNAAKYSPRNQAVEITGACTDTALHISIRDYGVGIPKAEQPYLFTDFFRASNVKTIPGTGVGLTIVRRSIELLGGQLAFESEENQGTLFSVILPVVYAKTTQTVTS